MTEQVQPLPAPAPSLRSARAFGARRRQAAGALARARGADRRVADRLVARLALDARAAGAARRGQGRVWTLAVSGELWTHVKVSAGRALVGPGHRRRARAGAGPADRLASAFFETLLDSTMQMVRNIPALALIPLVILWFGIDESAKLFLISVSVFFPIYLNTFHGIRNVDPRLIEMGAHLRALALAAVPRRDPARRAVRRSWWACASRSGLMWVILIVAETISAQAGIGYLTMNAREFLQTDVVLVGILLYALLGKLADVLARGLERWWLRWHPGYQQAPMTRSPEPETHHDMPFSKPGPPQTRTSPQRRAQLRARAALAQALRRRARCCATSQLTIEPGEFVAIVGPQRLRQEHAAAPGGGPREAARRRPSHRRQAASTACTTTRASCSRTRACCPGRACSTTSTLGLPRRRRARAATRCWRRWAWPTARTNGRRVCRAGSASASSLARALVHQPRLLLLDEPLGALDALTRIEMHRLIENLWQRHRFTALLVTHDVQEAVALADRVILIEDGRIALDEHIALARPRSQGDAAFAAIEKRMLDRVLQKPDAEPRQATRAGPTGRRMRCAGPSDPFPSFLFSTGATHVHPSHQRPQPVQGQGPRDHPRRRRLRSRRRDRRGASSPRSSPRARSTSFSSSPAPTWSRW